MSGCYHKQLRCDINITFKKTAGHGARPFLAGTSLLALFINIIAGTFYLHSQSHPGFGSIDNSLQVRVKGELK
jgi:hypothetical protein